MVSLESYIVTEECYVATGTLFIGNSVLEFSCINITVTHKTEVGKLQFPLFKKRCVLRAHGYFLFDFVVWSFKRDGSVE
jgi:hypothetical protein